MKINKILLWMGVILVAVVFLIPGLSSSLFFGTASCDVGPYNSDCTCVQGQRKIYVPWGGIPRWSCENLEELLIDPESPTFEDDAIKFTKDYLSRYCGDTCTVFDCGPICAIYNEDTGEVTLNEWEDRCMDAVFGYGKEGERIVNVECKVVTEWGYTQTPCEVEADCSGISWGHCYQGTCVRQRGGYCPWRMQFFVESETDIPMTVQALVRKNYCYDAETGKKCTHQSVCASEGYPDWCVGDLPLDIMQEDYVLSLIGGVVGVPPMGSGWPAPI